MNRTINSVHLIIHPIYTLFPCVRFNSQIHKIEQILLPTWHFIQAKTYFHFVADTLQQLKSRSDAIKLILTNDPPKWIIKNTRLFGVWHFQDKYQTYFYQLILNHEKKKLIISAYL